MSSQRLTGQVQQLYHHWQPPQIAEEVNNRYEHHSNPNSNFHGSNSHSGNLIATSSTSQHKKWVRKSDLGQNQATQSTLPVPSSVNQFKIEVEEEEALKPFYTSPCTTETHRPTYSTVNEFLSDFSFSATSLNSTQEQLPRVLESIPSAPLNTFSSFTSHLPSQVGLAGSEISPQGHFHLWLRRQGRDAIARHEKEVRLQKELQRMNIIRPAGDQFALREESRKNGWISRNSQPPLPLNKRILINHHTNQFVPAPPLPSQPFTQPQRWDQYQPVPQPRPASTSFSNAEFLPHKENMHSTTQTYSNSSYRSSSNPYSESSWSMSHSNVPSSHYENRYTYDYQLHQNMHNSLSSEQPNQSFNQDPRFRMREPQRRGPQARNIYSTTNTGFHSNFPGRRHFSTQHHSFISYPRKWIFAKPDPTVSSSYESFPFTMLSYNILCSLYIQDNFFPNVSTHFLTSEYRHPSLLKEILILDPDIICLQEVDRWEEWWLPQLNSKGYDGKRKPRIEPSAIGTGAMSSYLEEKPDGSAILYKKDKFECVAYLPISYKIYPHKESKENVGLAVILKPRLSENPNLPPRYLCVANTHLLFSPTRGDLKLGQIQIFMAQIDSFLSSFSASHPQARIALTMAGDFNSTPDSPMVKYILEGKLKVRGLDKKMMDGQNGWKHELKIEKGVICKEKKEEEMIKRFDEKANQQSESLHEQNIRMDDPSASISPSSSSPHFGFDPYFLRSLALRHPHSTRQADQIDHALPFHPLDEMEVSTHERHEHVQPIAAPPSAFAHRRGKKSVVYNSPDKDITVPYTPVTTIHHSFHLKSTHPDPSLPGMKPVFDILCECGCSIDSDTRLPVRYRPTSYHYRFRGTVDYIFYQSSPFQPQNLTPKVKLIALNNEVLSKNKEEKEEAVMQIEETEDPKLPTDLSPILSVAGIYDLPPLSFFKESLHQHERTKEQGIDHRSANEASSTTDLSGSVSASRRSNSNEKVAKRQAFDTGLPTSVNSSDHFPLLTKFILT